MSLPTKGTVKKKDQQRIYLIKFMQFSFLIFFIKAIMLLILI